MAISASPFASLQLSTADVAQLQELVQLFVQEHVDSYEQYLYQDQQRLDERRWKMVMQRKNIRVFLEQTRRERGVSSSSSTSSKDLGHPQTQAADLPLLLLVGTLEGTLDDVMHGVLNPTVESMRVKSSYVGDNFAACSVLATLETATSADPFRSHIIKWFEGDHPQALRGLIKNRDFVYMEATGLTQLSNGEVIGYHVMHSLDFPETPETEGNVRGKLAVCAVFRQRSDGVVDVFTKTTANLGGRVARAVAVKYTATALISAQELVRCSQLKKLAWLVTRRRKLDGRGDADEPLVAGKRTRKARLCVACGDKVSRGLFRGTRAGETYVLRFAKDASLKDPELVPAPSNLAEHVQIWRQTDANHAAQVDFVVVSTSALTDTQIWQLADALVSTLSAADVQELTILAALHLPYAADSELHVFHSGLNAKAGAATDGEKDVAALPQADAKWEVKDRWLAALLHLLKVEQAPCTHLLLAKGHKPGRDLSGAYEATDALGRALQLFTRDRVAVDLQKLQRELPRLLTKDKQLRSGSKERSDHLTLLYQ
ncbi:hypothetical protein BBJ28_00013378 [Nothophytophthora sp. Chile5]|nr:hypothetical protein BBJ28_00013378 [Nothophytophthora sp. Chile5]